MKNAMIRTLAFIAILATPVHAEPDRWSILLGSNHVGAPDQFNETNPGLFATWETDTLDYSVGVYHNSYGRTSVAATAALPVWSWDTGEASLFAGVAHYPEDGRRFAVHLGGDLVPIGGLQLRAGNAFVQIIPMDGQPVDVVVSFGVTWAD